MRYLYHYHIATSNILVSFWSIILRLLIGSKGIVNREQGTGVKNKLWVNNNLFLVFLRPFKEVKQNVSDRKNQDIQIFFVTHVRTVLKFCRRKKNKYQFAS